MTTPKKPGPESVLPVSVPDAEGVPSGENDAQPFPWDAPRDKPTPKLMKIPPTEATILKWLAGTTYTESETSIMQRAIRKELISMLTQRGFVVEVGEDSTIEAISNKAISRRRT